MVTNISCVSHILLLIQFHSYGQICPQRNFRISFTTKRYGGDKVRVLYKVFRFWLGQLRYFIICSNWKNDIYSQTCFMRNYKPATDLMPNNKPLLSQKKSQLVTK